MIIYRFLVERPKDIVEVWLVRNKDGSGFQFVNISKGHICPCKFEGFGQAVTDMSKLKSEGKIISFTRLTDIEFKPLKNDKSKSLRKQRRSETILRKDGKPLAKA